MPTLSIYVNHEVYAHMSEKGIPSKVGAGWIKERYESESNNMKERK